MKRVTGVALAMLFAGLSGCGGDPFGAPVRVMTHGYRAHAKVRTGKAVHAEFELAVRASDRRKDPASPGSSTVLVVKGKERKAFEVDPATGTAIERPFELAESSILPGFPLSPGFTDKAEAQRRGVTDYHRESDTVFAGHACSLYRFDDRPEQDDSPSTTYWVASDLDSLVVRVDRETGPLSARVAEITELTNVRVAADPALFAIPAQKTAVR